PNGAGKSTLIGVLLGLVRARSGTITVDGEALKAGWGGVPRSFRERVGYLPENVAFSENLSGRQILRFFASARGIRRSRVEVILQRVGLKHAAGRAVRGYSRGMRQRLGLGIAILSQPDLLVLDEPTGGLDQEGLTLLWGILNEWREAGRSVVLITHDLALIERRADHLYIFSEGLVRAKGSPDELRRNVGLPVRVQVEFDDLQTATMWAAKLQSQTDVVHDGQTVALSVQEGGILSVLGMINGEAEAVTHVDVRPPGLDDVYEAILGGAQWDA
ncbi:MAG: Cu-processing system ATP-binding protein, partial [Kiritimatiellia bacterium]